jgi:PAS domain S-box-containing protein
VLGAVVAMKDITELNASRERLAAKEKQLRAVTENLPALIGKVDAQGRFAFLNSRALQFYGKSSEELIGQPVSVAYSAEAYARIRPYIQAVQGGDRVSFEDSIVIKGRELHYHCVYVPDVGPDGRCDGFFAMAYDISARKLGELRQAESEERLRTITDNLPVLISYLDGEGRYRFANAVHRSWLGTRPEDMLGKTIAEAFGGAEYDGYLEAQADALARAWSGQAAQCEHEIVRKKQARIAHSTFLPQVRDGVVHGVYVLTLDATASRLHERNLHALAHTDALTQLPNRRHFEQALDGLGHRVRQGDRGCALLYLDVDHFKQINDRFGHATGDAVLVEFARRLRSAVRGSDLVARLAGDEFTVLLTDVCSDADVRRVAGKVLEAVRQPFVLGGGDPGRDDDDRRLHGRPHRRRPAQPHGRRGPRALCGQASRARYVRDAGGGRGARVRREQGGRRLRYAGQRHRGARLPGRAAASAGTRRGRMAQARREVVQEVLAPAADGQRALVRAVGHARVRIVGPPVRIARGRTAGLFGRGVLRREAAFLSVQARMVADGEVVEGLGFLG